MLLSLSFKHLVCNYFQFIQYRYSIVGFYDINKQKLFNQSHHDLFSEFSEGEEKIKFWPAVKGMHSWVLFIRDNVTTCCNIAYRICLKYAEVTKFNGTARLKNVNNCLNANTYSYLETSGGQSSNLYLNVVHFFQRQC